MSYLRGIVAWLSQGINCILLLGHHDMTVSARAYVAYRTKEVRAGFSTRTQQLLKRGEDPYAIEQELADENKRADDLHLILDSDPRTIGKGVRMDSAT